MNKEQKEEEIVKNFLDGWYLEQRMKGGEHGRTTKDNKRNNEDSI